MSAYEGPKRWVRWLASHGLPPDHVARVLGLPSAEVDAFWPSLGARAALPPRSKRPAGLVFHLAKRQRPMARALQGLGYDARLIAGIFGVGASAVERALRPPLRAPRVPRIGPAREIRGPLATRIKELHLAGQSSSSIAEKERLAPEAVAAFLARAFPHGCTPGACDLRPLGYLASEVRRLHISVGLSAPEIAEALGFAPETVAAYLGRLTPRQRHPRRRLEATLNRVRSPREQAALSEWPRCPEDDGPPIASALPSPARRAAMPAVEPTAIDEDWGSPVGRVGARSNNALLTDLEAEQIRVMRARGIPRADVAALFGVSPATITRITAGATYRPLDVEPDQVVDVEPPAIAAAEPTPSANWIEPRRPGRRPPADHRDD